jgi:hypothetical protein
MRSAYGNSITLDARRRFTLGRHHLLVALLARRTIHQKKVLEIQAIFRREFAQVPADGVASFLLHYFCCEASARVIVAARSGKTPQQGLDQSEKLTLRSISEAMNSYTMNVQQSILTRVFGENSSSAYTAMSARRLRDKIVHSLSEKAIEEITRRSAELYEDMQTVISATGQKADNYRGF